MYYEMPFHNLWLWSSLKNLCLVYCIVLYTIYINPQDFCFGGRWGGWVGKYFCTTVICLSSHNFLLYSKTFNTSPIFIWFTSQLQFHIFLQHCSLPFCCFALEFFLAAMTGFLLLLPCKIGRLNFWPPGCNSKTGRKSLWNLHNCSLFVVSSKMGKKD